MELLDRDVLKAAILADDPCGPDLDANEDEAYTNFMAATETMLPYEYMVVDHLGKRVPFHLSDRFKDLDLDERITASNPLVGRTHDIRLLSTIAKLHILNKSLVDFQISVEAIAVLLKTFWSDVHPRGDDGDFEIRAMSLERLDDQLIVSALNNAPLFRSKRHGIVTGQTYASLVHQSSGDKDCANTSGIDRLLEGENLADPTQLVASRAALASLGRDLKVIEGAMVQVSVRVKLNQLSETVDRLTAILDRILPQAPGATMSRLLPDMVAKIGAIFEKNILSPAGAAGGFAERSSLDLTLSPSVSATVVSVETADQAAKALAASTDYFTLIEPSSPALFLLRQAQALVGKSFLEAVEALAPDRVRDINLNVDQSLPFELPLSQLAEHGHKFAAASRDARPITDDESDAPATIASSRVEALQLLDQTRDYYDRIEPSSPIPLLIGKARALMGQDFLALVRSVLPP